MPVASAAAAAKVASRSVHLRFDRRASGILLHPTSLPGPYGHGDLGPAAHRFVDFLTRAGQRWWQMLPVGPPGAPPGNSPYTSPSAFAGSVWLISPQRLHEEGLLDRRDLGEQKRSRSGDTRVDYRAAIRDRGRLLRRAFDRFQRDPSHHEPFDAYQREQRAWLDDFVLFSALREHYHGRPWLAWPRDVKLRRRTTLDGARRALAEPIQFHAFCQYLFDRQWSALREHCAASGVGLIGDLPIFVGLDSADVWAHPKLFLLEASGRPTHLSGAPPDDFCADGQLWGHPQYRWPEHRRTGFAWWVSRFASVLQRFDGVRIDHFLGFLRTWGVPARARTARTGQWLPGPGKTIFDAVRRELGDIPIIAEDLGLLTPEAAALRDRCGFPGMRVMQFGFGPGAEDHLPHRYPVRCVAYTGTHDNDTSAGWFAQLRQRRRDPAAAAEVRKVLRYLNAGGASEVPWAMIRATMASVAETAVFPLQDVLGLGTEARMNTPGMAERNWQWRLRANALTPALAARLRELTELYDRRA